MSSYLTFYIVPKAEDSKPLDLICYSRNTHIYHRYTLKFGNKHKWGRVLASNGVSVPIDNFIFCYGAFSFVYSQAVVFQIFMFNIILKYILSLVILPLIYIHSNKSIKA